MPNTQAVGVAFSDPVLSGAVIDNSSIGSSTPASGVFTTVSVGTSASPVSFSSGNLNYLYGTATNTTGDCRLLYTKLNFTGAGGSGETLRAFTTIGAAVATGGTVNGAHVSLSVNSGGSISGAANAARFTFGAAASVTPGGTCAVLQVDSDLDNASTVPATLSYLRFTNTNTKKVPIFMNLDGVDTSTLYITSGTSAGSAGDTSKCNAPKVLHCRVNSADVYIPVFTQNS